MDALKYNLGDRVVISNSYIWAQGAKGTIAMPPYSIQELVKDEAPWDRWHRFIKGRKKIIEVYYVEFDEPQIDSDGDGPYSGGAIMADAIIKIS